MTKWVEQRICIKFGFNLEHPSKETVEVIQKTTATGNWWQAASPWQHTCSCIMSCAEFFAKHQITQVTRPPYSPDLATYNAWLFPKLKSPLKGKRFQTLDEIQENTMGQLMVIGRTVWGPKVSTLKVTKGSLFYVLVSCIFFNKCLYFP